MREMSESEHRAVKAAYPARRAGEARAAKDTQESDIESSGQMDWVTAATEAAQKAGGRSTPTVLVDGKILNDYSSIDDMAAGLIEGVE